VVKWAEPTYLWLLLLVPLAAAAAILSLSVKRRRLGRSIDPGLILELTGTNSAGLALLKQSLVVAALAFLLLAAARPKWGEKLQLYKGRGVDVVIALDASKSMLAEDVKPNRLGRAKAELSSLIDGLSGNAVGIAAFAGDAFVMCPLTTDLDAAKLFLDIISPDAMPVPGTDYGRAIDVSSTLFNPQEKNYKALIFVTDGEDMGRNTPQAVQRAAESGVRIFPVAFVTPEGAPIPEYDAAGNLTSYKKDGEGQVVLSRMNERQLILLARATDGRFLRLEGFSDERLLAELNQMRKKDIGGGAYTEYVERYQIFLIIALVLLLAGLALSNRRGAWFRLAGSHAKGRELKADSQGGETNA
jgi:Ca-activated chloride channel family protein